MTSNVNVMEFEVPLSRTSITPSVDVGKEGVREAGLADVRE